MAREKKVVDGETYYKFEFVDGAGGEVTEDWYTIPDTWTENMVENDIYNKRTGFNLAKDESGNYIPLQKVKVGGKEYSYFVPEGHTKGEVELFLYNRLGSKKKKEAAEAAKKFREKETLTADDLKALPKEGTPSWGGSTLNWLDAKLGKDAEEGYTVPFEWFGGKAPYTEPNENISVRVSPMLGEFEHNVKDKLMPFLWDTVKSVPAVGGFLWDKLAKAATESPDPNNPAYPAESTGAGLEEKLKSEETPGVLDNIGESLKGVFGTPNNLAQSVFDDPIAASALLGGATSIAGLGASTAGRVTRGLTGAVSEGIPALKGVMDPVHRLGGTVKDFGAQLGHAGAAMDPFNIALNTAGTGLGAGLQTLDRITGAERGGRGALSQHVLRHVTERLGLDYHNQKDLELAEFLMNHKMLTRDAYLNNTAGRMMKEQGEKLKAILDKAEAEGIRLHDPLDITRNADGTALAPPTKYNDSFTDTGQGVATGYSDEIGRQQGAIFNRMLDKYNKAGDASMSPRQMQEEIEILQEELDKYLVAKRMGKETDLPKGRDLALEDMRRRLRTIMGEKMPDINDPKKIMHKVMEANPYAEAFLRSTYRGGQHVPLDYRWKVLTGAYFGGPTGAAAGQAAGWFGRSNLKQWKDNKLWNLSHDEMIDLMTDASEKWQLARMRLAAENNMSLGGTDPDTADRFPGMSTLSQ